jgi:hypothetical protein
MCSATHVCFPSCSQAALRAKLGGTATGPTAGGPVLNRSNHSIGGRTLNNTATIMAQSRALAAPQGSTPTPTLSSQPSLTRNSSLVRGGLGPAAGGSRGQGEGASAGGAPVPGRGAGGRALNRRDSLTGSTEAPMHRYLIASVPFC